MSKGSKAGDALMKKLRAKGMTYPGAAKKAPWPGHDDLAVNDKTFAYMSMAGDPFKISLKLPVSRTEARKLRYATPTGYGLAKSGWVSFEPEPDELPSFEQLEAWLEESYRAQAPKKLVAELDGGRKGPAKKKTR